jgi:hypothetical protein
MKSKFIIILLIINSFVSYCQTYSYMIKTVKAMVQTSNGSEFRTLNKYKGPYSFVFQNTQDKLFTLLKPGENLEPGQHWYGFLKDSGYIEKEGVIYKKSLYMYTGNGAQVMVLISNDYNKIIIFNQDDTIWEFSD